MRLFAFLALLVLPLIGTANAQEKDTKPEPTAEAKAAAEKSLTEAGCKLGGLNVNADGTYTADDTVCAEGKSTVTLDKDFKVVNKTLDK